MNFEKVVFAFFTIFSCTLNFGFFIGDLGNPNMHHASELFAAIVVNLIALAIKFGDRTQLGATHLATSIVACIQLVAASLVWTWTTRIVDLPMDESTMALIVSMSGGALVANAISVILLIGETLRPRR